jgi:hypothetical protein
MLKYVMIASAFAIGNVGVAAAQQSTTKPSTFVEKNKSDASLAPGWFIRVFPYSKDNNTSGDPLTFLSHTGSVFSDGLHEKIFPERNCVFYDVQGYYKAKEQGRYIFSVTPNHHNFYVHVSIEDKDIFSGTYKPDERYQSGIDLDPGMYKISLTIRNEHSGCHYRGAGVRIGVRTPDQPQPRDFGAGEIFHRVKNR